MKQFLLHTLAGLLVTSIASAQWAGNGSSIYYNSGNVGIGTANPENRLHVESNNPILSTGTGSGFKFRDWKAGATANDDWHLYASDGVARLHKVNVGDLLYISSSGNIGIGNGAPPNKLSVNGDIYSKGHMWLYAYEGEFSSGTAYLQARNYAAGTNLDLRLRTQSNGQVVETMHLSSNGNVGIGTTAPNYKLAVNGTIGAREIKVTVNGWSDFVFKPSYNLPKLKQVAEYINRFKHLPEIPSEDEVLAQGVSVGVMQAKLLQKIEELTLYVIQQQRQIDALTRENAKKR